MSNESLITAFFKNVPNPDPHASKVAGRPIFQDMEVCEIRIAGDRNFAPVFPANAMFARVDGDEVTYAQRFPEQYARFKANAEQVASGTPLSELPFLTEAKRMELRGLKVYTAEALASLEGKNLTALGAQGREWKTQAAAYIARAGGSAETVRLASEVEALKAQIAELSGVRHAYIEEDPAGDERAKLKDAIEEKTGARPRGNPNVETLARMLAEA